MTKSSKPPVKERSEEMSSTMNADEQAAIRMVTMIFIGLINPL